MSYPPPPPPYGYPVYGPQQEHPQATTILILGILSVLLCSFVGPFAWVMGRRALTEIDNSGGMLGGRGSVMAGYICGIIASVLLILGLVIAVVVIVIAVVGVSSSSTY
jgi:phosphotransferase system  glucose/maltose/N-acetylglucosamine-specific IIC component